MQSRLWRLTLQQPLLLPFQHPPDPLCNLVIPFTNETRRVVQTQGASSIRKLIFGGRGLGLGIFGDRLRLSECLDPWMREQHRVGVTLGGDLIQAGANKILRRG